MTVWVRTFIRRKATVRRKRESQKTKRQQDRAAPLLYAQLGVLNRVICRKYKM